MNNLIWVLCYTGDPDGAWYPGDEYVDIAGADTYNAGDGPQLTMYNEVKTIINDKFPITYHECGIPPDPDECLKQNAMWSWWMEWHTTYLQSVDTAYLKRVYYHDVVITLDEVPDIMAVYGWDSACKASIVTPQIKADDGEWQQTNKILEGDATNAVFYPQVTDEGTWNWSGYGTSGSDTIQSITVNDPGSAMAVFTNTCGAVSTTSFDIIQTCFPTPIDPYVQVDGGAWQNTDTITVNYGASVRMIPHPVSGGSWVWSGAASGSTREITFTPTSSCTVIATHTNECGKTSQKTFTITVLQNTAISPAKGISDIMAYPNPCKDRFTLYVPQLSYTKEGKISIFSMEGLLILETSIHANPLPMNTANLKPGIYFLNITLSNLNKTIPFIKED